MYTANSITKDADIGLRIYGAGYRGLYIDSPVGFGLMPYDIEAYKKAISV
jgi:cellulose synthase/poly-beta-1,6-N-acetylglucosamine synthase-like glycosyltransferase